MRYSGDVGLYLSGGQVPVPECGLFVTQPTLRQIAQFGEDTFFQGVQILTKAYDIVDDAVKANPELKQYDRFQVFAVMAAQQEQVNETLSSTFQLVLPDFSVEFSQNSIDFRLEGQQYASGRIHKHNLTALQTVLRELFIPKGSDDDDFNPVNEAAARVAEKLRKAREKLKEQNARVEEEKTSVFALYTSTLSIGTGIDVNTLYGYTPFQIYDAFQRYWMKSQYDVYQQLTMTPMMDVSKLEAPKHWGQNMYGELKEDSFKE